jgi:hypothetical protein
MKTLQKQVETILANYPETRNSDIQLMIQLWMDFYPELLSGRYVFLDNLFDLPREDNIKRIRAQFQNTKRVFLPTSTEVCIERFKLSKEWKRFLGYHVDWNNGNWEVAINEYMFTPKQASLPFD